MSARLDAVDNNNIDTFTRSRPRPIIIIYRILCLCAWRARWTGPRSKLLHGIIITGRGDALSGWRIEQIVRVNGGQSLSRNLNHSARSSIIGNVNVKLRRSVKVTSKSFFLSSFFLTTKLFLGVSFNLSRDLDSFGWRECETFHLFRHPNSLCVDYTYVEWGYCDKVSLANENWLVDFYNYA